MGSHKTKNQPAASQAQFVQSPLTTAVRGALFASSAAVAFGVPSALAGDIPVGCVHTNLETVTCAGSTAVPLVVNTTVQPAPINDLTIVIGDPLDPAGTTVDILAPGYGAIAESDNVFGDATVINYSSITTYAGPGVIADAGTDATIINDGTIVANYGPAAIAIAYGGNAEITNNGAMTVNEGDVGAVAISENNDVLVTNNGDITVNDSNSALGVWAMSKYEDAAVVVADGATITANGSSSAVGIVALSGTDSPNDYADATIAGAVTANGDKYATGVYVGGYNMTVSVAATGVVTANAGSYSESYATATGVVTGTVDGAIVDVSVDGSVNANARSWNNSEAIGVDIVGIDGPYNNVAEIAVSNTGADSISATATVYGEYATAFAEGVYIEGGYGTVIDVYNSGAITATATASNAYTNALNSTARANGVTVDAIDGMTITNAAGGTIAAYATTDGVGGDAYAEGITASTQYGALTIVNDGAVNATATANLDDAQATGIRASNDFGNTSITGPGTVTATATAYEGAYAEGITAWSYDGDIAIDGATVTASANADNDGDADAGARGVNTYTWYGNTSISNLNITVDAVSNSNYANADSEARGVLADTYWTSGGYIEIDGVTANVTAQATGYNEAYADAWGIQAETGDQNLRIDNTDLTVSANASAIYDEAEADARGIDAYSRYGNINIYGALINVSATATSVYFEAEADATGIDADTYWGSSGDVYIESVDVTATATATGYAEAEADAQGIDVSNHYGNVRIVNATVVATASATTTNAAADEADADAEAIDVSSRGGNIYLGGITATARATANGYNDAEADTEVLYLYNESGNISIYDAVINGYADATSLYADADAEVKGIEADTWQSGYIEIDTVTINVSATANGYNEAYADAWGIDADGDQGVFIYDANVTATATANAVYDEADADAWGIDAYSEDGNVSIYDATVDVTAMASSVYFEAEAEARGVEASTWWSGGYVEIGGVDATVVAGAYAEDDADADAVGIGAYTWYGNISIYDSSADVSATAATANEHADAEATGISAYSSSSGNISVDVGAGNVVSATATASASYGWATADATGVGIDTDGDIVFSNSGDISATANASANPDYGWGSADAVGVYIEGGYSSTVTASNDGSISATAYGDGAWAVGMDVIGNDTTIYAEIPYLAPLTVINNGGVYATATGIGENKYAIASGIVARGTGDTVNVVNGADGVVIATANATGTYGWAEATAVHLGSDGDNYNNVTNHGLIAAYATGTYTEAFAVYAEGDANTTIDNYGTMVGAIRTGGGVDVVNNFSANTWFATGVSTFGGGDDVINNVYTDPYTSGRIVMTDAVIDLGGYAAGNEFNNQGLLEAFGDNLIDMGNSGANPIAFNNYNGAISLLDGGADDTLTILGDFYGSGTSSLSVDVDGAGGTADMLFISGDVTGGPTTVNTYLLTMPASPYSVIDIVDVGGNSAPGDFVLGAVSVNPDSLLAFDFDLIQSVADDPNDVFSLAVDVAGLSDPGVLASSLSPAVQHLWQTGVGTLHQRQGAVRDQLLEKVSVWLRTYRTDGTLDPDGAQSNLEFDQENTGYELGIDAALNEELRLGVLFSQSEADVDLNDAAGSADIDGDTWGVYLTWMGANGWYSDLSYRRMDFDGKAKSAAAPMDIDGEADGWNLEVGRTYTLDSGLQVEPQFQYTDMEVDLDDIVNSAGVFSQKDGDSTRARLGVLLRKGYQSGNAKWTPYGSLSVVEEFDGENSFNIGGAYAGESDIGGTSMLLETGVDAQFGDIVIYGGLNYQDGDALDGILGGQLGVRFSW